MSTVSLSENRHFHIPCLVNLLSANRSMADKKKVSSKEDEPMQRVLRQREMVESMKHENEVLRLDLTREARDARRAGSTSAAGDIARLQDEAGRFMKKIEFERERIGKPPCLPLFALVCAVFSCPGCVLVCLDGPNFSFVCSLLVVCLGRGCYCGNTASGTTTPLRALFLWFCVSSCSSLRVCISHALLARTLELVFLRGRLIEQWPMALTAILLGILDLPSHLMALYGLFITSLYYLVCPLFFLSAHF